METLLRCSCAGEVTQEAPDIRCLGLLVIVSILTYKRPFSYAVVKYLFCY
ncbi:MAG: hypothetical protein FWC89_05455 [Defluviitaleaceae bacterium]|nr:hypothetical protein [Defluviitaleaceae bacterium]